MPSFEDFMGSGGNTSNKMGGKSGSAKSNSNAGGLDYDQLMSQYSSGTLGDYLGDEFDLGDEYMKYITPLSAEPFQIAREGRDQKLTAAGSSAIQALGKTKAEASDVRGKSDLAFSSSIEDTVNQAKRGLFSDYKSGAGQAVSSFGSTKYDEEQRQLERFYDDIGGIISMKEAKEADSGGKK